MSTEGWGRTHFHHIERHDPSTLEKPVSSLIKSKLFLSFRVADNTGVEQVDQHCAVSKDLPLRLAGCFRHSGQYEVADQVRSWGQYRCGAGQPWSTTPGVRPMTSVGC